MTIEASSLDIAAFVDRCTGNGLVLQFNYADRFAVIQMINYAGPLRGAVGFATDHVEVAAHIDVSARNAAPLEMLLDVMEGITSVGSTMVQAHIRDFENNG